MPSKKKSTSKRKPVDTGWIGESKIRKGVLEYPLYQSETGAGRLGWYTLEQLVGVNTKFPLKRYLSPERYEALKKQLETEGFKNQFSVAKIVGETVVHLPQGSTENVMAIQEALEAVDTECQAHLAEATAHSAADIRTISLGSTSSSSPSIEIVGIGSIDSQSHALEQSTALRSASANDSMADTSTVSSTMSTMATPTAASDWFKVDDCEKGCKFGCVTILSSPSSSKKKRKKKRMSSSSGGDFGKDVFYYKVQWEGWPSVYDSWEPAASIPEEIRMQRRREGYGLLGNVGFQCDYWNTFYSDERFDQMDGTNNAPEKALACFGFCKANGIFHDEASDQIQLNYLADFGCGPGYYLREFAALFRPCLAYALEPSRKMFEDVVEHFEEEKRQFASGEKTQRYNFGAPPKRVYNNAKKKKGSEKQKSKGRKKMTGLKDKMTMENLRYGADYEHMYNEKLCHLELECMDITSYCHRELMKAERTQLYLGKKLKAGEALPVAAESDIWSAASRWKPKTVAERIEEMPSLVFRIEAIKEKNLRGLKGSTTRRLRKAVDASDNSLSALRVASSAMSSATPLPSTIPMLRKSRKLASKKRSLTESLADDYSDTTSLTPVFITPQTQTKRRKTADTGYSTVGRYVSDLESIDTVSVQRSVTEMSKLSEMSVSTDSSSSLISVSESVSSSSSSSLTTPMASSTRSLEAVRRRPMSKRAIGAEIRKRMESYKGWVPQYVRRLWHRHCERQRLCKHWDGFFNLGIFVSVGQYMDDESFDITMHVLSYYCEFLFCEVPTNYSEMKRCNGFYDQWAITTRSKDWYLAVILKYFRFVGASLFESKYSMAKNKDSYVASNLLNFDCWPPQCSGLPPQLRES